LQRQAVGIATHLRHVISFNKK